MSLAQIKALEKQIYSGKMKSDKAYILNEIMKKDCTIESLQVILTMQYSTITGRISDLSDLGVIYVKHFNKDKRLSVYSYQACLPKQSLNRSDRELKRFNKWKVKAKEFNRFLEPEDIHWITNLKR